MTGKDPDKSQVSGTWQARHTSPKQVRVGTLGVPAHRGARRWMMYQRIVVSIAAKSFRCMLNGWRGWSFPSVLCLADL